MNLENILRDIEPDSRDSGQIPDRLSQDGFPQMDVTTTILAHINAGRGVVHPITVKQTADYVRGCPFSLAACAA